MSYIKVEIDRPQVNDVRVRQSRIESLPDDYLQKVWLYKSGSRHPIEVEIKLPQGIKFYEEGDYIIDLSQNIAPDKYGSICIKPYSSTTLVKVPKEFLPTFDSFIKKFDELLPKSRT